MKVEVDKKEVKEKWSKANTKLIGKDPLCGSKHILSNYLSTETTMFREYLNLVEEEHDLAQWSNHIWKNMKEELKYMPIEEAKAMVNFMNTASEVDLQALRIIDRASFILGWSRIFYFLRRLLSFVCSLEEWGFKVQWFRKEFERACNCGLVKRQFWSFM